MLPLFRAEDVLNEDPDAKVYVQVTAEGYRVSRVRGRYESDCRTQREDRSGATIALREARLDVAALATCLRGVKEATPATTIAAIGARTLTPFADVAHTLAVAQPQVTTLELTATLD